MYVGAHAMGIFQKMKRIANFVFVGWVIYSVAYLFSANNIDATERATFKDMAPALFDQGGNMDSVMNNAKRLNIVSDIGLEKSLKNNPDASDISFGKYTEPFNLSFNDGTSLPNGSDANVATELSFTVKPNYSVDILFLSVNKRYLRNFSRFGAPVGVKISRNGQEHNVDNPIIVQQFFGAVFNRDVSLLSPMTQAAYQASASR
jgi:hypothetical protein